MERLDKERGEPIGIKKSSKSYIVPMEEGAIDRLRALGGIAGNGTRETSSKD